MMIRKYWILYFFSFLIQMVSLNIGSLNINGCRDTKKRNTLFKYLHLKKADVIMLQETHTDVCNEADWINEWSGSISLSHGTNLSAGVAFLISKRVKNDPDFLEIIPGRFFRNNTWTLITC